MRVSPITHFLFLEGGFQDVLKYKIAKCTFVKFALAGTCKRFRAQFYDKDMAHILYFLGCEQKFLTTFEDINLSKLAYVLFPFTCVPNLQSQFESPVFDKTKCLSKFLINVSCVPDLRPTNPYQKRSSFQAIFPNQICFAIGFGYFTINDFCIYFDSLETDEFQKCAFLEWKSKRDRFRLCHCCKDDYFFDYIWSVNLNGRNFNFQIQKKTKSK